LRNEELIASALFALFAGWAERSTAFNLPRGIASVLFALFAGWAERSTAFSF